VQAGLEDPCDQVLHLVFSLAIHNSQGFLGQLHIARSGVAVVVLEHDLDDVVNLHIAAVPNHVLHHFDCPMLLILILLVDFLNAGRGWLL
jgi:hypothetical protein